MSFGDQFHIEIRRSPDPWDTTVNVDQWFTTTENLLRKIAGSKSGQALLQAISDSGFWVTIQPLNWTECNAHGAPYSEVQKTRIFKAIVKFDPGVFAKGSHCFEAKLGTKYNRGGLPDEVLFHELVHAMRACTGTRNKQPISGGLWRYGDTEEFFAVVVTNIYISEGAKQGSSGIRGGERGKIPLESYFSNSLCFFASSTQILPRMKEFKKMHEQLFTDLSMVKAGFNPIKAMLEFPKAVENISNARATIAHEAGAEKHQKWLDDKRLAELRAAAQSQSAQVQKELEATVSAIMNASPNEVANQLGLLGKEAVEVMGL